jgi:hypothetical protein
MTSTSLGTDVCTYQEKLRRSVGPGMYQLGTPGADCTVGCSKDIPSDPYLRYQAWGPGACVPGSAVNDGSELLGLNYKASKCSADAYLPGKYNTQGTCFAGARGTESNPRACTAPVESTRLSNPPCTLRATGWNRWEWLCWDPQERAEVPFEWNVSYRIVSKDNHVPCLEKPMDQTGFMPSTPKANAPTAGSAPSNGICSDGPGYPFNAAAVPCSTVKKF